MSSMFDDIVIGAQVANAFFKGAKKLGKLAKDGIQKVNESESFQNLKTELQDKVSNSETLQNLKSEVRQRVSQITNTQPVSERKYCTECGASLEKSARFCSSCGAAQKEEPVCDAPVPEAPEVQPAADLPEEPEVYEARPTVLQNDAEEAPLMFDFQPSGRPVQTAAKPKKRERIPIKKPGKNPEPFLGRFHYADPSYDFDMMVYQDGELIRITFVDAVSGKQKNEKFDDWSTGGRGMYCHTLDCTYSLEFEEDGNLKLRTQEVYPGLEGIYIPLD